MANRDVSIAICGAVVGIILGAGSLAFSQDVSLQGSVTQNSVRTHKLTPQQANNARARTIYQRYENGELGISPVDRSKAPTVKDTSVSSSSSSVAPSPLTICTAVTQVLDKIAAAQLRYIPKGSDKYNELRNNLERVIKDLRMDKAYCDGAEMPVDVKMNHNSASSVSGVDNHCDRYTPGTDRFTVCQLYQVKGQIYN